MGHNRNVLVIFAQGCEELEAVTIIDLLRRADVQVTAAGLDDKVIIASRGVKLVPDCTLDEAIKRDDYDMVVLPGGLAGTNNLAADTRVIELLKRMAAARKFTCAICAAPSVLAKAGLLDGKSATAYPGVLDIPNIPGLTYTGESVVRDGTVITSRGPGTALDFGLALIEALLGEVTRSEVEKALVRS